VDHIRKLAIIPAYNEEFNIEAVINDLRNQRPDFDILVIDDGSLDRTSFLARKMGAVVVSLPFNQGIGAAVQTGYKYAMENGYSIAIQFDGDGQHRADQISFIERPVLEGRADLVTGSRFLETSNYQAGLARMLGSRVLSYVISMLLGQRVTDPTSGFRAAGKAAIEFFSIIYPDDYPEPESIVLLHKAGLRFEEVPVLMQERLGGSSSITPVKAMYYMIKVLLAIMIDMIKSVPNRRVR